MSWAWRSFLGQPQRHLLSRLLPIRRHGSQQTTVFGRSNLIGSRAYASKSNNGDATTKRHLYVVLDDHKDGFSVHKLDLSDNDDVDDPNGGATRRLTKPPVLRVTLATLGERAQFAAVGSNIVAIGTTVFSPMLQDRWLPDDMGGVLIYDTKSSNLTVAPHLPRGLCCAGYDAAMAVGNSLYMLGSEQPDDRWGCGGSLHCLTTDPPVDQVGPDGEFWGWEQIMSDSSPWRWSNYENPPAVPFFAEHIAAHAVQASPTAAAEAEHEIFVSFRPTKKSMIGTTFSFSRASGKWTWQSEWLLPVVGQAHYDGHLDAWVGLHAVDDGDMYLDYGPRVTDGRLCAGNITSSPTWWNVGKEKLFRLDDDDAAAGWRHADAKLVPMASGEGCSEYCLMERMRPQEETLKEMKAEEEEMEAEKLEETWQKKKCWGDGGRCLLRLTFFRLEHGPSRGELITTARLPARSYEVSWHSRHFEAQAFYM